MIVKPCHDIWPNTHPTARAAENAVILGDVTLEENSSLWFGVIARGDVAPIVIGANSNIQDGCLVHNRTGISTIIGKNVTAGHGAILHGCTVEDNCLIGMGAILLNGCVIGEGSIVAAGTLVTERTVIPPGSMVMGSPGKVVRAVRPDELAHNLSNAKEYIRFASEQLLPILGRKESL
ncbi:MAG: gamma carbonic anhydrase family protein [Oscillospiraceae bacterium]